MADNRTIEQRSSNMSRIRSTNTKPELLVRKFLFRNGFRYRLHTKQLVGKPDIVLPMYKTVIFVHGCFWHGHKNCKNAKIPNSNKEFWENKFLTNSKRDKQNISLLKSIGWKIYVVWECDLSKNNAETVLLKLKKNLLELD